MKKYRIRKNSPAYFIRGGLLILAGIAVFIMLGMTDCPVCHEMFCVCGK